MELILKDYLLHCLTPTFIIGFLFIVAVILLFLKKRIFRVFFSAACALLIIFSTDPVPEYLLNHTESQFQSLRPESITQKIKYVVVLAGGIAPFEGHPLTTQITPATLTRLIEGIRIHKSLPGSVLIVTGKGWASVSESHLMKELAVKLGVESEKVIIENESLNTFDHTKYLKPIVKNDSFILVTSALHMPRAMRLFLSRGHHPIPAPTQHLLTGEYKMLSKRSFFPSGSNLHAMDDWFKEFWSTRWAEFKGQI